MKEEFLHYIWKNRLFSGPYLTTDEGLEIDIIDVGKHNKDAGPDFFNGRIKLEKTVWVGNIEIHLKSSDWEKHQHHLNMAYDNVILHLVYEHDKDVFNTKGEKIQTLELKFNPAIFENYSELLKSNHDIACKNYINKIDKFSLNSWLTRLLIERIETKTNQLSTILKYTNNNWEETFYISLAQAFGFKVNNLPFELTAKLTPSIILAKNKSSLFKLEALIFGQAGMLNKTEHEDDYFLSLKKEYEFLKRKYNLNYIDFHLWKFLRIRPFNFPTIRISQFASLIFKSTHLFSKILEIKDVKTLFQLFDIKASEYWDTHYTFGNVSKLKTKTFGKTATENILINTIIPILFLYGKEKANNDIKEQALYFYEHLHAETNKITKKWASLGFELKSAYFSQAFIQLYNEYCTQKKCIDCRIGNQYLKK